MLNGKVLLTAIWILACLSGLAQTKNAYLTVEGQVGVTNRDYVPFWMRSNQYGNVPSAGLSNSWIMSAAKDYDTTKTRLIDWGASFQGRANVSRKSELILIEGYGKVKLWIFELRGGRSKESFGLNDTLLTTGNFGISGNALGIPKVQISIPDYFPIPLLGGVLAIKGNYAHGWLGNVPIQDKRVSQARTFFHQKTLYGRLGKPDWKLRFYAGFSDQVFWGSERKIFESFILTNWQSYRSVVFGKNWSLSKVGNHVGNIDLRVEYDLPEIKVSAYRQNFYEVGALYHLANIADGINGISFTNRSPQTGRSHWKKILFEFFYSKNQAGEPWSKPTPSGNENYLNHYLYSDGWSYMNESLGTPLITPEKYISGDQPSVYKNFFINNRVFAFHTGFQATIYNWLCTSKLTYSRNFGTHHTRDTFQTVGQFSGYAEISRELKNKVTIGMVGALDAGRLLNNSAGLSLKVLKTF